MTQLVDVNRYKDKCVIFFFFLFFLFQAEDGIRDLVRSRGLGDVYKRQDEDGVDQVRTELDAPGDRTGDDGGGRRGKGHLEAVSYTHLTLPTSDLVQISVVAGSLKKKT